MPATSKTQFRLFSQVYGVQKHKKTGGKEGLDPKDLDPEYRRQITNLANEMKPKDVKDMIDVDYQKLPDEVKESTELEVGTQVEFEHTKDKDEAEKIAKDHLSEDPHYYSKLYKAGLIDEPEAIKLAKSLEENNAMATPGSVNGMGAVALPGAPGTDETGSGDIAATSALTDDDEENDDDGKKIYKFLKFNAFVGESINEGRINTKQAEDYGKKLKKKVPSVTSARAAKHNGEIKLFVNYTKFADRAQLKRAGEELGLTYITDGRVTNRPGLDYKRGDKMVGKLSNLRITDNWMTFVKE